jgi:hypothetical protein
MPLMITNIFLCAVGIALIVALVKEQLKDSLALRLIFFSYFLVAMQYNFDRIQQSTGLLIGAGICFILWTRKALPSTEEDIAS